MDIKLFVKLSKVDKEGNTIKEGKYQRSNSLVQNWAILLYAKFIESTSGVSFVDITGTTRTIYSSYIFQMAAGGSASSSLTTLGIIPGSSTTAVSITDNKIGNQISTSSLSYSTVTYSAPVFDESTVYFKMFRTFSNITTTNITINELAIYVEGYNSTSNTACIEHTLITPYTITPGSGVMVEYKWQIKL